MIDIDESGFRHHAGVADGIFKLADVSRPGIAAEGGFGAIRDSVDASVVNTRELADEVADE